MFDTPNNFYAPMAPVQHSYPTYVGYDYNLPNFSGASQLPENTTNYYYPQSDQNSVSFEPKPSTSFPLPEYEDISSDGGCTIVNVRNSGNNGKSGNNGNSRSGSDQTPPKPKDDTSPNNQQNLPSRQQNESPNSKGGAKKPKPIRERKRDNRGRPPYSYIALISMAIANSRRQKCTLQDIIRFINIKFDYYRNNPNKKGWMGSIRHNLTLDGCFQKLERDPASRGHFWGLNPNSSNMFDGGSFLRRRYRFKDGGKKKKAGKPKLDDKTANIRNNLVTMTAAAQTSTRNEQRNEQRYEQRYGQQDYGQPTYCPPVPYGSFGAGMGAPTPNPPAAMGGSMPWNLPSTSSFAPNPPTFPPTYHTTPTYASKPPMFPPRTPTYHNTPPTYPTTMPTYPGRPAYPTNGFELPIPYASDPSTTMPHPSSYAPNPPGIQQFGSQANYPTWTPRENGQYRIYNGIL